MPVKCSHCNRLTPEGVLCQFCGERLAAPVDCPGCKRKLPAGTQKCQYCGAQVVAVKPPDLIPCPKCGKKMGPHLSACVMCGAALPRRQPQAAQPAQAAQPEQAARPPQPVAPASQSPQAALMAEIQGMLQDANKLMHAGKFSDALPLLEHVLILNPALANIWHVKATCLLNLARYAEAESDYRHALKLNPDSFDSTHGFALCLRELGKYDEALPAALVLMMSKPNVPDFANLAGFCYLKQGRIDEALRFLKQAIDAQPNRISYCIDYGLALQIARKQSDADACFERASNLDPISARPNFYRATRLERAGKLPDAAEFYYRASVGFMIEQRKAPLGAQIASECAQARDGMKRLKAHLPRIAEAGPMFAEAVKAEGSGEINEALAMYEEAAVLDPDNAKALEGVVRMRKARAEAGRAPQPQAPRPAPTPAQAAAPVQPAPFEPEGLLREGLEFELAGQKEKALDCYGRYLANPPMQREALNFARQHLAQMIESLRPPRVKPPPSPASALLDRASGLIGKQQYQQAVSVYDEALELDPNSIVAWLNMGACLDQLGRPEDAIKSFDRATVILPKMAGVWLMRATSLSALRRHEEALRDLDKALQLDPYESPAWCNKGSCLNALHRTDEALKCLERAVILEPFNLIAWFNKGCSERTLGKRDAAMASFKRFLALAPQGVEDMVEDARRMLKELESGESRPTHREQTLKLPAKPQEIIGNYEIYKELGRGGMGVVYLAVTRDHEEVCALKTFLNPTDTAAVEAFKREAKTWIDLDRHPNLVSAFYVDELRGRLYVAVEFVMPGPEGLNSLEGYLRSSPPGVNQALRWSIQFCHGMEYAYTKGIRCHRDIKPANIMIDWQKNLKITDFGLAAAMSSSADGQTQLNCRGGAVGLSVHTEGGGAGTPTHMPPEQWRSGSACDERSDIYAFGITLYQMAAKGKLPFLAPMPKDDSPQEYQRFMVQMYQLHCAETPKQLDSILWPLIERCTQKDPAKRFQSFRQLRYELETLLKGQAQGETVAAPTVGKLDLSERVNKALSFEALNRFDDAMKLLEEALSEEPNHGPAWEARAHTLDGMGRTDEALKAWDKAVALDPRSANAQMNKGSALLRAGRVPEALACYDQALAVRPNFAVAWRNKARAFLKLNRDTDALACNEKALSLEPEIAINWKEKGDTLRLLGRHAEAVECLAHAVKLDPANADAWNLLGESQIALQQFEAALQSLNTAVRLDPRNYAACVNRGGCLTRAGRLADAMACFDTATTLIDKPAMAWNNKGDLYVRQKQFDKALECFDRALECDPDLELALHNKAQRLRDLGRLDEGLALLERGLTVHPKSSMLWYFKAEFLKQQQQFSSAILAYKKVIEFEKINTRAIGLAWSHSGECSEKMGQFGDALVAYGKALQIIPNSIDAAEGAERCRRKVQGGAAGTVATTKHSPSVDAWLQKGRKFVDEKRWMDAVTCYTEALDEDSNCAEAWCELGRALGVLKEYPKSIICLKKALVYAPNSPAIWLNKAMAEDASGLHADAVASYKKFVSVATPDLARHVEHAKTRLAALAR